MNRPNPIVSKGKISAKKKNLKKVLYDVLLSKLDTQNEDSVIRIQRYDGKTLTANSYHIDGEYLNDEQNWMLENLT